MINNFLTIIYARKVYEEIVRPLYQHLRCNKILISFSAYLL